ncbi:uncharacterized protein LOC127507995 [Ctenopharyngodon idella]|uniref:uncharacterized protein LOC127507995 n=1 Tax=Ctenopharyngodon idella TaxID=7959 RepID=UPI002230F9B4|nr:uncharacterized protein LOC127507995 [Ctenopharyngodon idella]
MEVEEKCSDGGYGCQTLTYLLLSAIENNEAGIQNISLSDRLQHLKNTYPNSADLTNMFTLHQISNLDQLEITVDQSLNHNLCNRLQEIINSHNAQVIQYGSGLRNTSDQTSNVAPTSSENDDFTQPSTSHATLDTNNADRSNDAGSSSGTSLPSRADIAALLDRGGTVNGYRVLPRPRFNSVELQRSMNLREINSTDLAAYHIFFHDTMAEVVSLARHIGGDGSVINLTLKGPNLKSDVTGVLTPSNNYDVNIFIDQISRILQSDDQLMSDDQIEIQANIAMNRQGGGTRRKLVDLSLNEVIKRKKMSLFCPMNVSNKLCFSICLARFLNSQLPERANWNRVH